MDSMAKIKELNDELEKNPSDFKIRRELAVELMENGYNEEALKQLFYLLKRFPEDSRLHYNAGIVLENLKKIPKKAPLEVEDFDFDKKDMQNIEIRKSNDGSFEVFGGRIENLTRGVIISDPHSFAYFQTRLKEMGVIDMLLERGMKDGDTVIIKDITFEYTE